MPSPLPHPPISPKHSPSLSACRSSSDPTPRRLWRWHTAMASICMSRGVKLGMGGGSRARGCLRDMSRYPTTGLLLALLRVGSCSWGPSTCSTTKHAHNRCRRNRRSSFLRDVLGKEMASGEGQRSQCAGPCLPLASTTHVATGGWAEERRSKQR